MNGNKAVGIMLERLRSYGFVALTWDGDGIEKIKAWVEAGGDGPEPEILDKAMEMFPWVWQGSGEVDGDMSWWNEEILAVNHMANERLGGSGRA